MPMNFNVNDGDLGRDPKRAMQLSNSLRKVRNFGKAWEVGDQGTVFYPFKWWPDDSLNGGGMFEPHMSAYFGHKVSEMKTLGTTFLRSFSVINEQGEVVGDGDLAYQFSRIAGLLVNAQKERELYDLNQKDWNVIGQASYLKARQEVENKYDRKNNLKAIRPLVGSLTVLKITEVLYVAMDPNSSKPVFDDARKSMTGRYIQELSPQRLTKLRTLANDVNLGILAQNPGLVPEPDKLYFLEVLYNFTSATNSKSEAGRTDPQGVAYTITLKSKQPELEKKLEGLLKDIPQETSGISAHTYGLSPMPDDVLRAKLQQVLFVRTSDLTYLTQEDKDRIVKNAKVLDYLRVAPKEDKELNDRLTEELGHPVGEAPASAAPTLDTIMAGDTPDFSKQKAVAATLGDAAEDPAEELLGGSAVDILGGN